jgi:hypothetical protein
MNTICHLCPSTDIVGLCDVGGTKPDLRPACKSHVEKSTGEVVADLSEAQKTVLLRAVESTTTHSGRGGHSVSTMRALERKGFVRQGKAHTHDTNWHFTAGAAFIGLYLERINFDAICRREATSALKLWFPNSRGQSSAAIMAELEARGWQWQSTSADWTRINCPE